jgi:parvulin-like peptidyl-prolyl isomerase
VLLAILGASCTKPPPPAASPFDDPQVLAIVGEEKITKADFERAAANRPIAPSALLDELIEHRALVQTARERGYDRDPEHVAAVERLLANRVREELRAAQKVEVTDAEIEARYRAEAKKFTVPAKIRAAMIFVEAPATFAEEKRAERRAAIEQARAKALAAPAKFRALAAEYSYDQTTKFRGGDLGYVVEGTGAEELEPEVLTAAFALKEPGAVSEILTTKKGHYLLQLTERIEASVRPLAQVAAQIRADLQREKQQQAEQQISVSIRANRPIEARRDRLPAPPAAAPPASTKPPALPAER